MLSLTSIPAACAICTGQDEDELISAEIILQHNLESPSRLSARYVKIGMKPLHSWLAGAYELCIRCWTCKTLWPVADYRSGHTSDTHLTGR